MSTKIYNAYKVNDFNLGELLAYLQNIKQECIKEEVELFSKNVKKDVTFTELMNFYTEFDNIGERCAVIYPYNEELYIQFFSLPNHIQLDSYYFRDFHYQNQADKPDNISDKQWGLRELVWDGIFNKSPVPVQAGFTFKLTDPTEIVFKILEKLKNETT